MNLLAIIILFCSTTSMLYSMDDNNHTPSPHNDQSDPVTHLWKQPNTPEQEAAKDALGYRRYTKSKQTFALNQNITRAKLYGTDQQLEPSEQVDMQIKKEE